MANGPPGSTNGSGGVTPTEHYRNLDDQLPPPSSPFSDDSPLTVVIQEDASEPTENVGIEMADGSLIIRLDGKKPKKITKAAKQHDANLAEYIDGPELARICDDLL